MQAVLDVAHRIMDALAARYREIAFAHRHDAGAFRPVVYGIAAAHRELAELRDDVVDPRRLDRNQVFVALDDLVVELWRHEE